MVGCDVSVPVRLKAPRERLGSTYGGWWIRSDLLGPDSIVYSVGIGRDISFDLSLIERYRLIVHAFDPTRKCREWLRSQQLPTNFLFTSAGLANYDGRGSFVLRSRPDWDSYELNVPATGAYDVEELPVARLATLMNRFGHDHIDVLKLDIEGSEYDVISDMLWSRLDVRQLLVEFHYERRDAGHHAMIRSALVALDRAGYLAFARSPGGREVSFYRPRPG
jgi:FkbM family methyltransferase